jgi:hypothetical protein
MVFFKKGYCKRTMKRIIRIGYREEERRKIIAIVMAMMIVVEVFGLVEVWKKVGEGWLMEGEAIRIGEVFGRIYSSINIPIEIASKLIEIDKSSWSNREEIKSEVKTKTIFRKARGREGRKGEKGIRGIDAVSKVLDTTRIECDKCSNMNMYEKEERNGAGREEEGVKKLLLIIMMMKMLARGIPVGGVKKEVKRMDIRRRIYLG